jgi:acetyl-CoA C-acetyltransferase
MIDLRTPVVVGVGQTLQRTDPDTARQPIELLEDVARAAGADAGHGLLARVDTVAVVQIVSWPYPDPGAFLARRLGIEPRRTVVSTVGGNSPQMLLNEMSGRMLAGETDVVLLGGAEAMHTRWRARREPRTHLEWEDGGDEPCADIVGDSGQGVNDYEMAHGAVAPTSVYPLFETALRAAAGESIDEHQRSVSEL